MQKSFDPLRAKGFVWRDKAAARKLLNLYRDSGKEMLHFVWDWDGTVVPAIGVTWHAMRDALPPEGQEAHRALYKHYKPIEDAGQLTGEQEREWSERALQLHVVNNTPLQTLEQEAAKVETREHAELAFSVCIAAKIPTIILSAGVKDIIAMVTERHNMHPTAILGAELIFGDGKMTGWRPDSLVEAQTKKEMGHPDLLKIRQKHPHAVLFGDQIQDAGMLAGSALRIRIDGRHTTDNQSWAAYLKESWAAGFDAVTVDDDLLAVAKLNEWLVNKP